MTDRPTAENAQAVLILLEAGKIPNSVLLELRRKFENDPILAYWEEKLPDTGADLLSRLRYCYRTTGDLGPAHHHLDMQLYQGFVWSDVGLITPIAFSKDGFIAFLEALEKQERASSPDLDRSCSNAEQGKTEAGATKPRRVMRLDRFLALCLKQKGIALLPDFDFWEPAKDLVPLNSVPTRDESDEAIGVLRQQQREVLQALIHWIVSCANTVHDDRVVELSHLVRLIAEFGNFVWGVQLNGQSIAPIVVIEKQSTLQSASSSTLPRTLLDD